MPHKALFDKLAGRWEGTCRTWFEPGKLADESQVAGEITKVLDDRFLRHTHEGKIQDRQARRAAAVGFVTIYRDKRAKF